MIKDKIKRKVWNPNIANEARKAWVQWKKWQSWNPNWQPRKWVSFIQKELEDKWITPLTKTQIENIYLSLIDSTEDDLQKLIDDKDTSVIVKIVAKEMLSWNSFKAIWDILDRWIWKALQKEENTTKVEFVKVKLPWSDEQDNLLEN